MEVDIEVDPEAWEEPSQAISLIRAAVDATVAIVGSPPHGEMAVLLASDAKIRELNQRYRGKSSATNVLSFPAVEIPGLPSNETRPLGDIVLAGGVIRREAQEQGKRPADHLCQMVVHGVLHLLGHDHESKQKRLEMQALEKAALKRLDIAAP
jgi:probable rRNA maturation factor